ncbi:hypothetical protein GGG87_02305 [Streptococcus sp. zg-86]|uniref:Uncharacterized protein n=1 Tax=Streptococcus zhangguiae TaxID=2664091 RepID=A0A6I4RG45_9STRE|nr:MULTISPECIES: hypothetical protein [unclassified Streptococcus]MTB63845.1 hypothetical protein [Streptococcus sp. zg-86]MTB90155.1 hypothetical protein [Streptococcus sp. zg-36]MWV55827.1 hypothetical protein [Streptococcus sp. zg-70]QTH47890.1 hypothetical protein J5M87_00695 [Streptococcus sp. zg-86]
MMNHIFEADFQGSTLKGFYIHEIGVILVDERLSDDEKKEVISDLKDRGIAC